MLPPRARSPYLDGEAQGPPDLDELAAGAQPRQGQRRVLAAGDHQVQGRRQVVEQEGDRRRARPGAHQVVSSRTSRPGVAGRAARSLTRPVTTASGAGGGERSKPGQRRPAAGRVDRQWRRPVAEDLASPGTRDEGQPGRPGGPAGPARRPAGVDLVGRPAGADSSEQRPAWRPGGEAGEQLEAARTRSGRGRGTNSLVASRGRPAAPRPVRLPARAAGRTAGGVGDSSGQRGGRLGQALGRRSPALPRYTLCCRPAAVR